MESVQNVRLISILINRLRVARIAVEIEFSVSLLKNASALTINHFSMMLHASNATYLNSSISKQKTAQPAPLIKYTTLNYIPVLCVPLRDLSSVEINAFPAKLHSSIIKLHSPARPAAGEGPTIT